MSERENILTRVREALRLAAPVPGTHIGDAHPRTSASEAEAVATTKKWLPAVGDSFEDHVALFAENSAMMKTEFHLLDSREALTTELQQLATREAWKKIGCHIGSLAQPAAEALGLPTCLTDHGFKNTELESCDAGITECDALIAQTGSILVTNRSAGGRSLSILPPHHVVVATRNQLIGDLPAAFVLLREKYAANYPSMISLITGPSRTGDIERILVLGAHGPKKLTVFCI